MARAGSGDTWHESTPPFTWPVLAGDDARWAVHAAMNTVVAQAYGLNREQYIHVLSTFSHKSYPKAPALCLARFDELTEIGLEALAEVGPVLGCPTDHFAAGGGD